MQFTLDLPETLSHNGVSFTPSEASAETLQRFVSHILDYGFGKAMQDAVAGRKKALVAEGVSEDEITETLRAEMQERLDAILSGTMGTRAARLSGPDAIRREVVDYFFNQWKVGAVKKGLVLPTLKNTFNVAIKESTLEQRQHIANEIAKIKAKVAAHPNWASKIEDEVARRLSLRSSTVVEDDFDLGILDESAEASEAPKGRRSRKREAA